MALLPATPCADDQPADSAVFDLCAYAAFLRLSQVLVPLGFRTPAGHYAGHCSLEASRRSVCNHYDSALSGSGRNRTSERA